MAAYWYRPSRKLAQLQKSSESTAASTSSGASGSERKVKDFRIRKVQLTPPKQEKWFYFPRKKKRSNEHEENRCPVFDATGNEAAAKLKTQHDNRMPITADVTGPTSSHRPRATGANVSDAGMHYLDQQSEDENTPLTRKLGSRNAGLASTAEKRSSIAGKQPSPRNRFIVTKIHDDEAPLDTPVDSHARQQLPKVSAEGTGRTSKTAARSRFLVTPVNEQASSSVSSVESTTQSKSAVARNRFSVSPVVLPTAVESAVENEQRPMPRRNRFTVTKVSEASGPMEKPAGQPSLCAFSTGRPSGSSLAGQPPSGALMSTQIVNPATSSSSSESLEVFENSPQFVDLSNVLRPSPSSVVKAASQSPKLVSKTSSTPLVTPSESNVSTANSSTPMFTPPSHPPSLSFTPPTQEAVEPTPPTPLTSPEVSDSARSHGTPIYTPVESPETVSAPLVTLIPRKPVPARGRPFTRHGIVLPPGFKNLSPIAEQSPNEDPPVKPSSQKQVPRGGDRPKDTRQEALSSVKHITKFHFSVVTPDKKQSSAAVVAETTEYDAERKRYKDALRDTEAGKASEKQRSAPDGVPSTLVDQQQRCRPMDLGGGASRSPRLNVAAPSSTAPPDDHEFVTRSSLAELYAKVMAGCNRTDEIFRRFNRRLDALQEVADAADACRPSEQ